MASSEDSVVELLSPPSCRHVTYIFMGRSHQCSAPLAGPGSEASHDTISAGMRLWFADAQSAAYAALDSGVVGSVHNTLLHEWHDTPATKQVTRSLSLVDTVLRAATEGVFKDTTTLVLHWAWGFADCCLPLRGVTAVGAAPSVPPRGPRAAWPAGHMPYFDNKDYLPQRSMSSFLWRLSTCMPQLTRLHLEGGCSAWTAGLAHCAHSDAAAMQQWRTTMNACGVFTAASSSVPEHWTSPRRPAPVRWLGDNGDTAGAGADTGAEAGAAPMHPHIASSGTCRDTIDVGAGELALVPGVGEALSHSALARSLATTNGLWRELLLTAYLPPAPPVGALGRRLLELHLHDMLLSSRDVAALPLIFPHLRFLRLYYCRGYSRLAMEATAEHFSPCSLCLLGGGSMYRTGPAHALEDWCLQRSWTSFLGKSSTPVHSALAGPARRRLVPRAGSLLHGAWLRRRAALLRRAALARPARQQATAHSLVAHTLRGTTVPGVVILSLAALRAERNAGSAPEGTPQGVVTKYAPLCAGGEVGDGTDAVKLWWWRGSHVETRVLQGGEAVLRAELKARGGAPAGGASEASMQHYSMLLRLAARCQLRCSPSRAKALLAAAAGVPGAALLGYGVLDHDRDELSGMHWPVGGDWRKGGAAYPQQEPSAEAGWRHFWHDPR